MDHLTVLLIHGAWMNATCWDGFRDRFEEAGYDVVAPSWPHVADDVELAREGVDPALVDVGLPEIVAAYEDVARSMPSPPILVGHSFGGLVVQLMLDHGVGRMGVAIDAAPPKGVAPSLRAAAASLAPALAPHKVHTMSERKFAHTFANASDDPIWLYGQYAIPAPGLPFHQLLGGRAARLDWTNDARAPLLLIGGGEDHTITPSMTRATARHWQRSTAQTELMVLPGRDHALIVSEGWDEVAAIAIDWIGRNLP